MVVIGLDSTRHLRWTSGKLRSSHLDRIDTVLAGAEDTACKVAFLHHPPATALSGHPFEVLADRGIDLVLAGHVHKVRVELIAGAITVRASWRRPRPRARPACATKPTDTA